jgi:hemoglobin-like flavoprotein
MTPQQKTLVQNSFSKVLPIAGTAATLFYEDLFKRDPSLRALFKEDMTDQKQKLMATLSTAVWHVDKWEKITEAVKALGRRHAGYGVKPADYDTVGASLIATLEKGLGADFTPEVREAWQACIALVAKDMLDAATPA